MTTTAPAAESRTAVSLALVLADLLGFGLPEPHSISVSPWVTCITAINMQFDGPDLLGALSGWAARFDVPVELPEPGEQFARVHFTYSGVRCQCYARLGADE
jgi:hypothetical protein